MLKNRKQVRGIDIRDIACDGWGLTAEMAALNKLSSKGWEKLVEAWKDRLLARNKADSSKGF